MRHIVLRELSPETVAQIAEHGAALGAHGLEGCARALVDYAIEQRGKRASGGATTAARRTPEERSAAAKKAVNARIAKRAAG